MLQLDNNICSLAKSIAFPVPQTGRDKSRLEPRGLRDSPSSHHADSGHSFWLRRARWDPLAERDVSSWLAHKLWLGKPHLRWLRPAGQPSICLIADTRRANSQLQTEELLRRVRRPVSIGKRRAAGSHRTPE